MSVQKEETFVPWWDRDEDLKRVAEKYDSSGSCCCRDEGVEETVYYICPVCRPQSLTHMRAIVKHAMKIAYDHGKRDALEKIEEKIKEVWNDKE